MTTTHITEVPYMQFDMGSGGLDTFSPLECDWTQDDALPNVWHTDCGTAYELPEGSPTAQEYWYCPNCGGMIYSIPREDEGETK